MSSGTGRHSRDVIRRSLVRHGRSTATVFWPALGGIKGLSRQFECLEHEPDPEEIRIIRTTPRAALSRARHGEHLEHLDGSTWHVEVRVIVEEGAQGRD